MQFFFFVKKKRNIYESIRLNCFCHDYVDFFSGLMVKEEKSFLCSSKVALFLLQTLSLIHWVFNPALLPPVRRDTF